MGYIKTAHGRSWHVIRTWTRVPNVALTLCGRRGTGPTVDSFGAERSCESCLRVQASQAKG